MSTSAVSAPQKFKILSSWTHPYREYIGRVGELVKLYESSRRDHDTLILMFKPENVEVPFSRHECEEIADEEDDWV